MSNAAKSVIAYGIFLLGFGVLLLLAPNLPLVLLGFGATQEIWVRVMATLIIALGYYYTQAARHDLRLFFRWTVVARSFVTVCEVMFVVVGLVQPILLLFAALEAGGALWTGLTLRADPVVEQAGV